MKWLGRSHLETLADLEDKVVLEEGKDDTTLRIEDTDSILGDNPGLIPLTEEASNKTQNTNAPEEWMRSNYRKRRPPRWI